VFALRYPTRRNVLDRRGIFGASCVVSLSGWIFTACSVRIVFVVAVGLHEVIVMFAACVLEMHIRDVYPFA
jgi:hypothetical protein